MEDLAVEVLSEVGVVGAVSEPLVGVGRAVGLIGASLDRKSRISGERWEKGSEFEESDLLLLPLEDDDDEVEENQPIGNVSGDDLS